MSLTPPAPRVHARTALAAALLAAAFSTAAMARPTVDFLRDVQPVLATHCYDCHGEESQKNGLRLDTVHGILKGSDSGEPLFLRANSAESLLIRMVTSSDDQHKMPPKGQRLPKEAVETLASWIDNGAPMPGEVEAAAALQLKTDHWSFQPLQRPEVPPTADPFVHADIDAFVLAKMQERGLRPSPPTDRATLLRRLYFVMHGLPPTPEQVQAFLNDRSPEAYARRVDEVLASPRYGERWARHWMDVVRYADTNGFETNRPRPTAYHYRDWVIEAFNSDKPYDQFVREQIAGDALDADAATGFLVAGTYDIVKSPDINLSLMQRQDELADMVNTTGTAFMGLTMGCARCHNHKFDPILQKDYFAMQAVFAGVNYGERPLRTQSDSSAESAIAQARSQEITTSAALEVLRQKAARLTGIAVVHTARPAVNARLNEEVFAPVLARAIRFTIEASSASEPCLDELEVYDASGVNVALASTGATPSASSTLPGNPLHKLEHLNDGITGNSHSWIANGPTGWVQIDFPSPTLIQRIHWGRDRMEQFKDRVPTHYRIDAMNDSGVWTPLVGSDDRAPFTATEDPLAFIANLDEADATEARRLQASLTEIRRHLATLAGSRTAWIGTFSQPEKTHRLYRGEPMQKREVVAPDVLSVLGSVPMHADEPEQQRRIKFAQWMTRPDHPLTARVLVNRLWHYIFGHGIVSTPSDFGTAGARPTHPELLDWLADEFIRSGWSVKHIQRLILRSATFQQSSTPRTDALTADADALYLWRFPPRRLEAEAIRDGMLATSGALDLRMGGPGFSLMDIVEENVVHYFAKEKFTPAEFRRMVYQFRIRQTTDSVFSSFDCPDGGQVMPKRSRSNTPLQALNLFNSTFVLQQADILAQRLVAEAGSLPENQITHAFTLLYNRPPDAFEHRASATFIREQGLPSFCRALFNTSEFLFVF
jgi:hypothetical protein